MITVPEAGRRTSTGTGLTDVPDSRVKERFPDEQQVIISADPLIEYEDHRGGDGCGAKRRQTTCCSTKMLLSAGVR